MKKQFLLLLTIFCAVMAAHAQNNPKFKVDENSLVKDSLGNVYKYDEWYPLLQSGQFGLEPENIRDKNTAFILHHGGGMTPVTSSQLLPESGFFKTGETFKAFDIEDIYAKKINKKAWAGKTVVINYWFIACAPCRDEMPKLNKLVAKYAKNPNVMFVAIAPDKDFDIKVFASHTPFNYTLIGNGRYYLDMYNIHSYPTNVVVDKEGEVSFHTTGFSSDIYHELDKAIADSESKKID